jgi:hypothetical protein
MSPRRCLLLCAPLALVACGGSGTVPAPFVHTPQPIVEIVSDLSVPADIDSMRVELDVLPGVDVWSTETELGPGTTSLPARFTPGATSWPDAMTVRVIAWRGATARVIAEAPFVMPKSGDDVTIRVSLDRACVGFVAETSPNAYASTCGDGATCRAGACVALSTAGDAGLDAEGGP